MAREYSKGTATDGGGSGPKNAKTIEEEFNTAILKNAAFESIEVLEPAKYVQRVYKCKKTVSGMTKDWYFFLSRNTETGEIAFGAGEEYNTGTHVLTAMPSSSAASKAINSEGFPTATIPTFTLNANPGEGTNNPARHVGTIPSSCFWAVITDVDGVHLCAGEVFSIYVGQFTSTVVSSIPDPFALCQLSPIDSETSTSKISAVSRVVGVTSPAPTKAFNIVGGKAKESLPIPSWFKKEFVWSDILQGGSPIGYPFLICHNNEKLTELGVYRGIAKHTLAFGGEPTGYKVGDTVKFESNTWVFLGPILAIDTGAP